MTFLESGCHFYKVFCIFTGNKVHDYGREEIYAGGYPGAGAGRGICVGSNLSGMHGGGAARVAYEKFGAVWGQGTGLQGRSYGIPTMQGGVETIRPYVNEFIGFARQHPELTFLVTRIGCGIAGFRDEEIAPLFKDTAGMANVILPRTFADILSR